MELTRRSFFGGICRNMAMAAAMAYAPATLLFPKIKVDSSFEVINQILKDYWGPHAVKWLNRPTIPKGFWGKGLAEELIGIQEDSRVP